MMSDNLNVFIETNTDCNATGSATWDCDGHHVIFSVYGPDEAKQNDEYMHRAYVDVVVTSQVGQKSSKEVEVELYMSNVLERLIDVKEFPGCKFTGRLFIVSGDTTDPRTVASAINAASLALLISGLPLKATICAVCTSLEDTMVAFVLDVIHPKLIGYKCNLTCDVQTSLFSVYTGQQKTDVTKSGGFAPETFLKAIRLEPDSDKISSSSSIYKQALDLVQTMISQLSVCTKI